jgi:hypothetical protein
MELVSPTHYDNAIARWLDQVRQNRLGVIRLVGQVDSSRIRASVETSPISMSEIALRFMQRIEDL